MGTHHSGLVKWVRWCINVVQNKTFDRVDMLWKWWLQNTEILGNLFNSRFCLWNVDSYQFRGSFKIENTPPVNRRSGGTKTFSIVTQNS
jgi:hypothetical protein